MKKLLAAAGIALAATLLIAAGLIVRELYRPYRGYSGSLVLEIEPGTPAPSVAGLLVGHGVLAHRLPFLTRYALGRPQHTLKSGEYLFDRPLEPIEVYRKLVEGDVFLHPVVIPEGSDRYDMARIFQRRLGLEPETFLRTTEVTALIHDLDPKAPTLEGYLYPDTYRFARGVSSARVVETMVGRFRQVLRTRFRAERANSGFSLHDVVTLASLVEKETPDPEERPIIAGVFENRLERALPLACDPTVIYAARLEGRKLDYPPTPITESDLKFDSPYNTYLHISLPPGPISSPGEVSLGAAFHPASVDFVYFVSNNHGGHTFARTLAEHLRNVARYRQRGARTHRPGSDHATFSQSRAAEIKRGGNDTEKDSAQPVKRQKPKTDHSGVQPGSRSGPSRPTGNPGHPS